MYRLKTALLVSLISFLSWMPPGCTTREQPEIKVVGSTTILPFMVKVSESYSRKGNSRIQISGGGSIKGVSELIDGKCSIAMTSSPIPVKMLSHAESTGFQLKGFSFANDLIVPIVHPSNPISNLSFTQLSEIYAGNTKSWGDVGGQLKSIEVVTRGESSGTEEVWKQVIMNSRSIKSGAIFQSSNSGVLAYVAEHPEAIGYVSYALLNHEVKPLSVNGVAPSRKNEKLGKYPISRRLNLYVNKKNIPHYIKSLIVFILSNKGQQITKECGFVPLDTLKNVPLLPAKI